MPGSTTPVATRVMTRCPLEGKDVFTGHRMRPAEMAAIDQPRAFRCAVCGQIHTWTAATAHCEERARV